MKLGLGTVQFGLDYGVTNSSGKPTLTEVRNILVKAFDGGVDLLDTASAYGESESVLGELHDLTRRFKVVTKIQGKKPVREEIEKSLERLKRDEVDVILFHSAQDLLGPEGAQKVSEIEKACKDGLVKKWGVSVYEESEACEIYQRFPFQVIQLPINVFDQRFVKSGYLGELKKNNVEIHVRSLFLQGLLLAKKNELPPGAASLKNHLDQFFENSKGASLAWCLAFARTLPIDYGLIGVEKEQQLLEILKAYKQSVPEKNWPAWAWQGSSDAVDPRKWRAS